MSFLGYLLVAPLGMLMGCQDDLGSHRFALRCLARIEHLSQLSDFVVKELDRILGAGSGHCLFSFPKYIRPII
jgi:hypothetical protein